MQVWASLTAWDRANVLFGLFVLLCFSRYILHVLALRTTMIMFTAACFSPLEWATLARLDLAWLGLVYFPIPLFVGA